jgi:hypothetical protein
MRKTSCRKGGPISSLSVRQSQFNPNIARLWAHDLGISTGFKDWSPEFGGWLERSIRTLQGFATPTGVVTPGGDATPLPLGWFAQVLHAPLQVAEHAPEEFTAGRNDRHSADRTLL